MSARFPAYSPVGILAVISVFAAHPALAGTPLAFSEFWVWWQAGETTASAIQKLSVVVLSTVGTAAAVLGLSTYRRQLRAASHATAVKEVLDSAVLVCECILIERLSPTPMVYFTDMKGYGVDWQNDAIARIKREIVYWNGHKKELQDRVSAFNVAIEKNHHTLDRGNELKVKAAELCELVKRYVSGIEERVDQIAWVAQKSSPEIYEKMMYLTSLSKNHPLLWRKERNLTSLQFEGEMRKSMDTLRVLLTGKRTTRARERSR